MILPQKNRNNLQYAKNDHRSKSLKFLLLWGSVLTWAVLLLYLMNDFDAQVEGIPSGFFCPCHGSTYDMAGRVFSGVPAPEKPDDPTLYVCR